MRDDAFDDFWDVARSRKKPGKFFTYEERGWSVLLERSGEFEDYLTKQKLSDSTIRTYPADVADFHGWMQDNYNHQLPRHLYREHVIAYRDALVKCRVKPQTINHKLSALRKYNEYLIAHKYQRGEVFKRGDFLKLRPKQPKGFGITDSQISRFLDKIRKNGNPRDIALVTLLAHTGMKLQEALELSDHNFDWQRAEVTVNAGDKKKERTIPLHEQAVAALKAYHKSRNTDYPKVSILSRFFVGQGSYKLTYSTVNRLFQKHSKMITPKTLRQSFQADQLKQGATVAEVVQLTGADAQTVSSLVKRQAAALRKRINARQL